jgi:N-acetylmuramoyl-L-alanine amidase
MSEKGKGELSNAIFNAFEVYKHKTENQSSFAVHSATKTNEIDEPTIGTPTETAEKSEPNQIIEPTEVVKNNVYYSIQIAASTKKIEPVAANFKGLKNVFRTETNGMYRYYSGKYNTVNEAENERKTIIPKFQDAFIVVDEDGKLIPLKK